MDVAIADLIHSNLYKFGLAEDPKFQRVLDIARRLPPTYKPPSAYHVGDILLDKLYDVKWMQETQSLLKDSHTFGASVCGDGATQKTVPMINCLGQAVHNSFTMLDVFDCTDHCARGGKKDAEYIAGLFLGVIAKLENMEDHYVSLYISEHVLHRDKFTHFTCLLHYSYLRERSMSVWLILCFLRGEQCAEGRGYYCVEVPEDYLRMCCRTYYISPL